MDEKWADSLRSLCHILLTSATNSTNVPSNLSESINASMMVNEVTTSVSSTFTSPGTLTPYVVTSDETFDATVDTTNGMLIDDAVSSPLSQPSSSTGKNDSMSLPCPVQSLIIENLTALCIDMYFASKRSVKNEYVIIMFSLIFVVSLFGNMFVVWVIVHQRRTRSTVNVFIGNLAVSDLLMTIFNVPMAVSRLVKVDWPFGRWPIFCPLNAFLQSVFVYVSTLSMTYIAIDRYQAISRPMREKFASPQTILLVIWVMSCIFSLPFATSYDYKEENVPWRDTPYSQCIYLPDYPKTIGVATFTLQFAIPLILMIVLYSHIAISMSKDPIGASAREQQQSIRSKAKKKTIIMLVLVAGVFTACWMPFNVFHLLIDFGIITEHWPVGRIVITWIAFSSVCYNPFIYCWLHRRVQSVLKSLAAKVYRSWCRCCTIQKDHYRYQHANQRGRMYYTCSGQAVYDDVDEVIDIQRQIDEKVPDTCTPFCTASAPSNSDNGQRYANSSHDARGNVNNGVLVLSRLISSSADNYNDSHNFNNNSSTCSPGKCDCYADEIRSMTHSTLTGCPCKPCRSSLISDTLTTGSCPIGTHYKSREESTFINCCGRGASGSGSGTSKHLETNSNASSSGNNGCLGNSHSAESSRRLLVRSKKCQQLKNAKLLDVHKNHLYCHKSKRISNISSC